MFNLVEKELKKKENTILTENGAIGYSSTGSALVDLNFKVSSLRNSSEDEIISLFDKAFYEDKKYTMKWLFFARDIREGLGERRLFRICYKRLIELDIDLFYANLDNIAEYGRWDDLVSLIGVSQVTDVVIGDMIKNQLDKDLKNLKENKPISLLGKWLPSENASSVETKKSAKRVRRLLDMTPRKYRVMLSELREYLRVVEVDMCSKQWKNIDYEKVPSLANLKYENAFMRNDAHRRTEYLKSAKQGKSRMNMSAATPVDIVSKYTTGWHNLKPVNDTLEIGWKNLKDIMVDDTLVVADGSGSMTAPVGNNKNVSALDVAIALSIYTSEHNSGVYKNKYITFSKSPQFVEFGDNDSLREKIKISMGHSEIANTNIEAVFKLILALAVKNNVSKDEMINNVLIISDMEFDAAQRNPYDRSLDNALTKSLFEEIMIDYNKAGYDLPRLIFWNVNSRTGAIPLAENKLGVTLVSGFSQNVLRMVMSSKYNPYEVLIEVLDGERYDRVKT